MIDKLVQLKDGRTYRIIDSFIYHLTGAHGSSTKYLAIETEFKRITSFYPYDITDIVEWDNDQGKYISVTDLIVKNGIKINF